MNPASGQNKGSSNEALTCGVPFLRKRQKFSRDNIGHSDSNEPIHLSMVLILLAVDYRSSGGSTLKSNQAPIAQWPVQPHEVAEGKFYPDLVSKISHRLHYSPKKGMNLCHRYLISSTKIKHDPVQGTRLKNINIHT